EVEPYPEGIILDQMSFLIVGEPTKYASREDFANVIKRNGGKVTGLWDADFVILCGDAKKHFCERWPLGYSFDALDEAEQDELYAAEEAIEHEIDLASRAMDDCNSSIAFWLYTGSQEGREDSARDDWRGWTINIWRGKPLPAMSEEEFAFFDPNGPAGHGGRTAMPGAVEAFARKCAEAGITRENLRIIGGRFYVSPFGDSWWEDEERRYQWGIKLPNGERRSSDEWDWQDTAWWPFEGEAVGVPYASVASSEDDRSRVRHLNLSEFTGMQITNLHDAFAGFESLQDIDLSCLDTSQVTDMSGLFNACESLRHLDLSHLDTSRVTDMSFLFNDCKSLRHLDLSHLDTSQVTNMRGMFSWCGNLLSLDLSCLDTSQVTDMHGMFQYCVSLADINLLGLDTSQVTDMHRMFLECCKLRSLDLSSIDASKLTNTKDMFKRCFSLERLVVPESWPVGSEGAIPTPTAENGMWWSMSDGRWMTVEEIRDRGPVEDTYTNVESVPAP
ncbi:MAG: BspA family leucine-rich repeat surface protein, partial [Atopobiaceae bacterium]|nr:BspA family leucine-rich repeat surface protein [Atopobiaceae bacterium]